MRIAAVEVTPYALAFERPYVTARGRLERREMVLVELRTDEGVIGLGEAVPLSLRGGASLGTIERELREDWTAWLADRDVDATELDSATLPAGLSPPSRAAIEMALIDAAARLQGVPAWRLLGANAQRPIECNATLAAAPPAAVAERAAGWMDRGFETLKLKVGVAGDVEQVAAVRSAVGGEARIRVDANGVWSPPEAIERLTTMERHGIQLAEQPAADLEGLAAVRARTAIPIAADESVATPNDARRAVELGSCQLATVKLAKVGGIGPALAIDARLPVYLSSALDGPVGIAAAATAAQVLSREGIRAQLAHGLATQLLFEDTIASRACQVRDGQLHLPDGHGLGVEIDAEALERHRL